MNEPESIISQVSPEQQIGGPQLINDYKEQEYYSDNTLIHLNIQGRHYYITRDQLMSLPESLLLCLFPSGVFMDREGQVITNLTPEDEVYIANFPPDCFESIMRTYSIAEKDLQSFPVNELFDRRPPQQAGNSKTFYGFNTTQNQQPSESDILHEKPAIIVLREDLDYYCVPTLSLSIEGTSPEEKDILLEQLMTLVKNAAGSHLCQQTSVFQGLYSSNRMKSRLSGKPQDANASQQLGPAEQHLMDMLCSSGFKNDSNWGNRTQEPGKTVISSLSLCRLMNETVQEFRDKVEEAKRRYEQEQLHRRSTEAEPPSPELVSASDQNATVSVPNVSGSSSDSKRKSRLSTFAENVRSRSASRTRSNSRQKHPREPTLYELVEKPEINTKLLLFWKKPARKCWWGMESINVNVQLNGHIDPVSSKLVLSKHDPLTVISVPVNLHIRRVWALELSIVGM
ncbi:HBR253Cp [Eremothecium sinecaudum]|uniref:HBR253Cp n=1 Tax=Eremothecium sinecaudum TaxID=45286 RepID=A0A120K195_9SACH|nr:HBR253Cp [Eremothecium sinecaudum]AMD19154.1 HBR253Cp [Eremothecium sinecaudum]